MPRGSSVLDIGCGSGLFLGLLRYFGFEIRGLGLDASAEAIECAQMMARRHGGGQLSFELAERRDTWPSAQFDVVSMIDVMHHIPVPEQRSTFEAAAARVAPSGLLLYKDMSDTPMHVGWANRLHDLVVARQWIHPVPADAVERWAESVGLILETASSYRVLWYAHDLRVFRRPLMP